MTERPTWFTDAVGTSRDDREIEVEGARITYRAWGKSGNPVVVLVHGGAANAAWWDHIAPHLSADHRVIAIDLSGHGDSDHRESYDLDTWADEVVAVARAESERPAVLFGHSMGGFVVLRAATRHGDWLRGVVAIDSPVREMSPEARAWMDGHSEVPGHKIRPDLESIIERFRTLPRDTSTLEYVRRHIAEQSVQQVDGGWIWKFDQRIFFSSRMEPEELASASCDVALLRGERGMATSDITDLVRERLGREVPVTVIPDAGHHIMLDQPVALIASLQTLLGQWRVNGG